MPPYTYMRSRRERGIVGGKDVVVVVVVAEGRNGVRARRNISPPRLTCVYCPAAAAAATFIARRRFGAATAAAAEDEKSGEAAGRETLRD